jgi:hypothetical protein
MNRSTLNRRDVNRLALAALGGLVTGASAGCGGKPNVQNQPAKPAGPDEPVSQAGESAGLPRLLQDPHVCRGINTCKNKGKPGTTNQCAGQAHCATVASHDCNGMNDCKGEGGCGEHPGENQCKGQGSCAVPLSDKTWPKARKRFEELMAKAGKEFGEAPPKDEA